MNRPIRRSIQGMTLIEIIVVITILSLLMAAVGVAVIPKLNEAKVSTAKLDIANIQSALKMYYAKNGKYPENGTPLNRLYDLQFLERAPVDPWDHDYVYVLEGGRPVVKSYGEDGAPGGTGLAEDISSVDLGIKRDSATR